MHLLFDIPIDQERESISDLNGEFNSITFGSNPPVYTRRHLSHEIPEAPYVSGPHDARTAAISAEQEEYPYVWSM